MWLIRSRDTGKFVASPGSLSSYTRDILKARRFPTKEAAQADACGNEYVVHFGEVAL